MKYFGFVFMVFFIIVSSCSLNTWDDSIITNESDFDVTFKFNNTKEYTLYELPSPPSPPNTVSFKTEAYQHLVSYSPEKRVYFTYTSTNAGYTGEFKTRESWEVIVNNTLSDDATLSADGWMDEMKDITSGNGSDANHKGKIYTDKPKFSVETASGFPAIAQYNFDGVKFNVTIQ